MPTYYKSTAMNPGGGTRKGYRHGGRNLRDEEARVIGVQDNAADELRRVRRRRPKDASEVRNRRAQLARVGSRERNARDEMRRLRGYQMGGGIDSLPRPLGLSSMMQQQPQRLQGGFSNPLGSQNSLRAAQAAAQPQQLQDYSSRLRQGRVPPMQPPRGMNDYQRMGLEPFQGGRMASNPVGQRPMPGQGFIPPGPRQAMDFSGSPLLQQQLQKRLAAQQATGRTGPTVAMPRPGEPPRTLVPAPSRYVPDQTGTPLPQQWGPDPSWEQAMMDMPQPSAPVFPPGQARRGGFNPPPLTRSVSPRAGRGIAPVQRGSSPKPWFPSTQRPEYLPERQAQFVPWARGGRVGLKKGGRIPRKKGAKFI